MHLSGQLIASANRHRKLTWLALAMDSSVSATYGLQQDSILRRPFPLQGTRC